MVVVGFHLMEPHSRRVEAHHDPRVRLDLIHRVRRVVDGVAIFFFRLAHQPFARLDVELRDHQAPLVDRRDHQIAHPFHRGTGHRGFNVIENYLLERDVNDVELRRLGPREHPFLAMPAQVNVRANIVRIAQMVKESDERIDHVVWAAFLVELLVPMDDVCDRFSPLLHDAVEVPIDQVGGLGANLDALGRAAPNRLAPKTRQRLLDLGELASYRLQLFGSWLNRRVVRFTMYFRL